LPKYDFLCPTHGVFEISCRLAEWSLEKPCPKCKKPSEQVHLPCESRNCEVPAIVVHVAADGSVRFPAATDAPVPKGFEKKELRSIREIEQFERRVNLHLRAEAEQHAENEERHYSAVRESNRSDLRARMQSMSNFGRDFARFAMEQNNNRKRKPLDVGFFTEILHMDRSNRDSHNDERTDWKRKHG